MKFLNSDTGDFEEIFRLYDAAIVFQKTVFDKSWLPFDREMISKEIAEKRHWKILIDDRIGCIFSVTFSDELIWKEKKFRSRDLYSPDRYESRISRAEVCPENYGLGD